MGNFETVVKIKGQRSGIIHEIKDFNHNGFKIKHSDRVALDESLIKAGLNIDTLISMLESNELDTRLYALEVIKPCKQFYNYIKNRVTSYHGGVEQYNNLMWGLSSYSNQYKRAIEALREYYKYLKMNKNV